VTAPARKSAKVIPITDLDLDPDPAPAPKPAARPRQVSRPMFLTCAGLVTALLGWRYAGGHHPGRTLPGHLFWFALWDTILTLLLLWVITGYRHRNWRHRGRRRYEQARVAGQARRSQFSAWYGSTGKEDHYADPVEDDADDDGVAGAGPGSWPAPPRRSRPVTASPSTGKAPPEWLRVTGLLTEVDGENGQEVLARVRGAGAGLRAFGEAIEELRGHLTTDRGYDPRALSGLGDSAVSVATAAGSLRDGARQVLEFYEHLVEAAEDGKRAPVDGREMEE
jgi:hypothetical protein